MLKMLESSKDSNITLAFPNPCVISSQVGCSCANPVAIEPTQYDVMLRSQEVSPGCGVHTRPQGGWRLCFCVTSLLIAYIWLWLTFTFLFACLFLTGCHCVVQTGFELTVRNPGRPKAYCNPPVSAF